MESAYTEQTEAALQAECFMYAWNYLPSTRYCLFAVPNGGRRNRLEASRMKGTGTVAGIPDMLLIWLGTVTGLEFKTTTGRLSPAQEQCHAVWGNHGVLVHTIREIEEFKRILHEVTGIPFIN